LLLLAALAPATAVAQRMPQPVFTELFAYDPAAPSLLLAHLGRLGHFERSKLLSFRERTASFSSSGKFRRHNLIDMGSR
jgi:hypothetical protein